MVRRDGLVKVLDFGLAKLTESPVADARLSDAVEKPREEPSFADGGKEVSNRVNTESGLLMGTLGSARRIRRLIGWRERTRSATRHLSSSTSILSGKAFDRSRDSNLCSNRFALRLDTHVELL